MERKANLFEKSKGAIGGELLMTLGERIERLEFMLSSLVASVDSLTEQLRTASKLEAAKTPLANKGRSDYLTIREAAAEFNLSQSSLYKMKYLQIRRGRSIRIRRSDLKRIMALPS